MTENNEWVSEGTIVEQEFVRYFDCLFASDWTHVNAGNRIWKLVPRKVTYNMNEQLLRPFSNLDVKEALFSMNPYKSPGMDGMGAGFFQKFWDTEGPDVCLTALNFLQGRGSL